MHGGNGERIWILGIINTRTHELGIEASKKRNSDAIKNFLLNFIDGGNTIITDGWTGYNFINNFNDYAHEIHNHWG